MAFKKRLGIIAACSAIIICCSKKKEDNPLPEPEAKPEPAAMKYGNVGFHLHFYVGNDEVTSQDANTPVNGSGRKISFGYGKFYLSDFEFVMNNGVIHTLPDAVILKKNNSPTYIAGSIPVGNYKLVRFKVGLKPNSDTLSTTPDLTDPTMVFGNSPKESGHIFINIQGKIDTTSDESGDESSMVPYVYKIGTSQRLTSVINLPEFKVTIREVGTEYFHLIMDISKLFTGIELYRPENLSVLSAADNNSDISAKIAANIPATFRLELY